MKNQTKTIKKILILILIALVILIGYLKFKIEKEIEYISDTREQNITLNKKIYSVPNLNQKMTKLESLSKEFDELYVEREGILKFIETIEKLSEKFGIVLTIDNISLDKSNIKEDQFSYGVLNMNLNAIGKFDNLNQFLIDLENLPLIIEISNVRINYIDKGSQDGWSFNVMLKVLTN
jgi:Tfp pilus assembly protein PilO